MDKEKAWDYALGLIKVDGLEPSKEFLEMVEKEKRGEISEKDIEKYLQQKYQARGQNMNTVNPDNFNDTMDGYVQYAIDFAIENKADLTAEQVKLLKQGLRWAKDNLTMEDARRKGLNL